MRPQIRRTLEDLCEESSVPDIPVDILGKRGRRGEKEKRRGGEREKRRRLCALSSVLF
jgi:hypothetical protein